MAAFPLDQTRAIILTWPDNMVTLELINWLHDLGIAFDRVTGLCVEARDMASANNQYIHHALFHYKEPYFIFADNDMKPLGNQVKPFLEVEGDVISCESQCAPKDPKSTWGHQTAFHAGLWRCSRKVLETIPPPWFAWGYSDDGCELSQCTCDLFRRKALDAGFSVAHAGWCGHKPHTH